MQKEDGVPASLARLVERFADWRAARSLGERIPKSLWKSAARVAKQLGVNRVATSLRLDYYSLKKHVHALEIDCASTADGRAQHPGQNFVELEADLVGSLRQVATCVVEIEKSSGDRMRIQLSGPLPADLVTLGQRFWDRE